MGGGRRLGSDRDSPRRWPDLTRVDLLVHAAGVLGGTYARKQTFEQWRTTMSANLDSCFVVTHAALPMMRAGFPLRVRLLVGRTRADAGPHRVFGVQGRHERVRAGAGAGGRPRRHQRQHRHPRTGGNRDAARCPVRDARHHRRTTWPTRSRGSTPSPTSVDLPEIRLNAVTRGPSARPPIVPLEVQRAPCTETMPSTLPPEPRECPTAAS